MPGNYPARVQISTSWRPIRCAGAPFFINTKTGETHALLPGQKPDPGPVPEGWDVRTSRSTGDKYYLNKFTGKSQYAFPAGPAKPDAAAIAQAAIMRRAMAKSALLGTDSSPSSVKRAGAESSTPTSAGGAADKDATPRTAAAKASPLRGLAKLRQAGGAVMAEKAADRRKMFLKQTFSSMALDDTPAAPGQEEANEEEAKPADDDISWMFASSMGTPRHVVAPAPAHAAHAPA